MIVSAMKRRAGLRGASIAALSATAVMGMAVTGWIPAHAEPPLGDSPALAPSSPPSTAVTADGWALTVMGKAEYKVTVPPPPNVPPSEAIVGGTFAAILKAPEGRKAPTPGGSIEVGYETQCIPNSPLGAMMAELGTVKTVILEEEFAGVAPSVRIDNYRVSAVCPGKVLTRSYAVLTRTTDDSDSVVAYYGVFTPL
ncbi:MspA [Mycobacterium sp. THAF192]|nr:MspA [Mycobacterium sp. THAF192]